MKEKSPSKTNSNEVKDELAYCEEVIAVIENKPKIAYIPAVKEKLNVLKEVVEDYHEQLHYSTDEDAHVGHKTADSSFFGYKTHIAMNNERIITAAIVKTGEKSDRKFLQSAQTGMAEIAKSLYNIEAKSSELKNGHGYDTASSTGLLGLEIQSSIAIFSVNLKQIITLLKE